MKVDNRALVVIIEKQVCTCLCLRTEIEESFCFCTTEGAAWTKGSTGIQARQGEGD